MLMMMMIIIINWKGYFSVNPILSFGSFLGKKSAVVNVVIAPKYLQVANGIYLINNVFTTNFYQQGITDQ